MTSNFVSVYLVPLPRVQELFIPAVLKAAKINTFRLTMDQMTAWQYEKGRL